MRKQYKTKKRSCGLCKLHKKGWDNRWKPKDTAGMRQAEREIKAESPDWRRQMRQFFMTPAHGGYRQHMQ